MASAISQKLEEKLVCSICLELFRVPVTLPCGHNFCKRCISDHWHKQEQEPPGAKKGYTCPECRRGFEQRPELEKNVTLYSVVELARDGEARVSGTEGSEVAHGELCPQHGRPLELYCEDERRCICCVCTVRQCQQHRRVLFEEERFKKQVGTMGGRTGAMAGGVCRLSQLFPAQDSSEGLKSVILSKFALLRKALEDFQWQTVARIEQEQAAALGHVEEDWSFLKDRLDVLGQHRERAQGLLACPDHRTFLQVPCLRCVPPCTLSVRTETWSTPSPWGMYPQPSLGMGWGYHRNLTFDPKTANKYLELSKGNRKAKHGPSAICGWQEQGPRFEPWQVMCTQGYGHGHHYWEVKISSHSVILGVTYHGLPWERQQGHKFNIGLDGGSWGLQVREDCYLAWHKGQAKKIQEQLYKNLGVSLDYGKGLLSFYGLGEKIQLIHSFHNVFTQPLIPVFWLSGAVVLLR
uniref:Tripartite motif containing 65 n=1 Tax=Strix occidentalis caurina TaxID=311401 RepID=A0A8D0FK52_STROC